MIFFLLSRALADDERSYFKGHWFPLEIDTAFAGLDKAGVDKARKQTVLLRKWNTRLLEWALEIKDQNFAPEEDLLSHFKGSFLNNIFNPAILTCSS